MNNQLEIINEQEVLGKDFKIYGTFENPLFLAKDVAEWIDYSKTSQGYYNVSKMLMTIDEDEKMTITNSNSGGKKVFLTEDGLYEVLMQSRKPIAKQFKKEVKKILKEIRKTGEYSNNNKPKTQEELAKDSIFGLVYNKIEDTDKRLEAVQHISDYSIIVGKSEVCDDGTITIPMVKKIVVKHYGDILMNYNIFLSEQFCEFSRFLLQQHYLVTKRFPRKIGVGLEKRKAYQPTELFEETFVKQGMAVARVIDERGKVEVTYTKDIEKYIISDTFKFEFFKYLGVDLVETSVAI